MMPKDHVGLLIADTRRAMRWEAALLGEGIAALRVETRGADADKGAWQIVVPRRQAKEARAYVSAVHRGDAKLPSPAFLSRSGWIALVAIAALLGGLVVLGLATS